MDGNHLERWKEIDEKLSAGYDSQAAGACNYWTEAWAKIKEFMRDFNLSSTEEVEQMLRPDEWVDLLGWAGDFDTELGNAAIDDISYAQKRIDFCEDFVSRLQDQSSESIFPFKQGIAESCFRLGQTERGEAIFQRLIEEDPANPWAWIGWSDQYWLSAPDKELKNGDKAIEILERALEVDGIGANPDILERLYDVYKQLGRVAEAAEVKKRLPKLVENYEDKQQPIRVTKIGRNEPCPCGSGKKYKKCCGK